jgi:hypothetical protein
MPPRVSTPPRRRTARRIAAPTPTAPIVNRVISALNYFTPPPTAPTPPTPPTVLPTSQGTVPPRRQSNKLKSCVLFYEGLLKNERLNDTVLKLRELISSASFTTIIEIINTFNNKYKLITENIDDCKATITDRLLVRRLGIAEARLEKLYTVTIHGFIESKLYDLIVNNTRNGYDDKVSSVPLTQKERDLKYIQSSVFEGFDDSFKPLENQLVRLSNIYADDNSTRCSQFFKKTINIVLTPKYIPSSAMLRPSLSYYIGHSRLAAFYVYWESFVNPGNTHTNFEKDELLLCKISKIMMRGIGADLQPLAGIDAGGVSRDFITDVVNELKDSKIFKCLDENDENNEAYYYIDPDFNFNDYFKSSLTFINNHLSPSKQISINYDTEQFKINFFKFFGNLLSFLLINEFTIPFKLSSAILSTLVYPDVNVCNKTYHHQFYYLYYDKPEIYRSYKDFIKEPSNLEYACFNADDLISDLTLSDSSSSDITTDNFAEYLEKLAKYRFPQKTHPYYKAISEGFNKVVRNSLNMKSTPLLILDKLISNTKITIEEVQQLKEAFQSNMTAKISSIDSRDEKQNTRRVSNYIITALSGPFSVKKQNDRVELLTESEYLDFVSRLLRFWSGWNHFKQTPNLKYNIKIIQNRSIQSLPSSHTCFYQIDMPPYDDLQTCLDKLYMVVYNVELGIGLAGGSKKRRKVGIFRMDILKKKLQKYKSIILKKKMKKSKRKSQISKRVSYGK